MSKTPVIPVKQANITIGGETFVAVLFSNGDTGLVFPHLCEWLGLYITSQTRRLRAHPTLSAALVLTLIQTPGGPQATNIIVAWGLPLWLARIQPDKRPPLYRERLLVLQRDARVALSKEFFQNVREEPAPPKRKKPSASLEKSPSVLEALQGVDEAVHALQRAVAAEKQTQEQEMRAMREEQQEMRAHLKRLESRQASPARRDADDAFRPPLTEEQCHKLKSLLRQVQSETGIPYEVLELEVADHCGADHLSAIPQAAWTEALAWVSHKLGFQ